MKPTVPETAQNAARQQWSHVGEYLHRLESSGVYYAFLKRGRKQFRRSLKTTDKALAKRRLAELCKQVARLQPQEGPGATFNELAERWLASVAHTMKPSTVARHRCSFKGIAPFFISLTIRNITPRHCEEWVSKRGFKIAAQTFAHELDTMRAVFRYAEAQGLILTDPSHGIKRMKIVAKRATVPSREQFQNIVTAIRESDGRPGSQAKAKAGADLVEILAYSGCRLDEARNLRWSDVDFERGVFTITGGERKTKNHEARTIPLTDAMRQLLARLHQERDPKPGDAIVSIQSAKKCIETACRRLSLPHFHHHTFRHFWATTAIESGCDIPTVAKMMGHKDGGALAMKTYGHLRQEHAFNAARKINFGTEQPANVVTLKTEATA